MSGIIKKNKTGYDYPDMMSCKHVWKEYILSDEKGFSCRLMACGLCYMLQAVHKHIK